MLGLCFCVRAFSSCGERGPLFIAVRGPLTTAASLVAEHRLQTLRLSSCGSRAQLLRSMWDLPRPGLEPMSPALAGRFSTTAPPGKPQDFFSLWLLFTGWPHPGWSLLYGVTHVLYLILPFLGIRPFSLNCVFEAPISPVEWFQILILTTQAWMDIAGRYLSIP